MLLATFNANSIRARLDAVIGWLSANRPDVLCVQETKVVDELFPEASFTEAGYHAVYRGQKSYNGVAIMSLQEPDETAYGFDDGGPPDDTRLACARFDDLWIVNTYVPQGRGINDPAYQYKLEWFRRLKSHFETHFGPRRKVAWVGDLNVAPEPIDIFNPEKQAKHVCFHEDVRAAFADVVNWGFEDVYRKHNPGPGNYSFFDYRTPNAAKRGMGWRLDHVMATRVLAEASIRAYIDLAPRLAPRPSDHTFVVAEFK